MISIIIPTYNRKPWLHDLICEIGRCNAADFECVIVDDASTDGTSEMVESLLGQWRTGGLVYLRQERNSGAQVARNRGVQNSTGSYLLFMDSDDMAVPEGIFRLKSHLQANPKLDFCFGRVLKTDTSLKPFETFGSVGSPFQDVPREVAGYHWHTMGALYSRECVNRIGPWNPALTGSQDWEYQARVKLSGSRGEFVDTLVGYWRQHDGERVGAPQFRLDYVRSVILACESIMETARAVGRCDKWLEERIAKRLVLHALELGANLHHEDRKQCFERALGCLSHESLLKSMVRILSNIPSGADMLIWRILRS